MRVTLKSKAKHILMLLGIMLGMECIGSRRDPFDIQLSKITLSVTIYRVQEGKFPGSLDELTQYRYTDGASPPLEKKDLADPWGKPIGYEYTDTFGGGFILWSAGPDRKIGTADDIVRGLPALVEDWKARHNLTVDKQGTNVLQAATPESVRPSVTPGKKTPDRVTAKNTPPEDAPTETNAAPWKLLLFIGVTVIGAIMAWRYFRRRRKRK